jgi:hypothetical protein
MREGDELLVAPLAEIEPLEPSARRGAGGVGVEAVQPGEVGDLVDQPHLRVQPALLGHVPEPRPIGIADRVP